MPRARSTALQMDVTKAADIDAAVRAMEGEMRAAGGLFALVNNGARSRACRAPGSRPS